MEPSTIIGEQSKMSADSTCRLCGSSSSESIIFIYLFSPQACDNMLQYKIVQLLDIAIGRIDYLSHFVCVPCVNELDSLWCFKNQCHIVQTELRNNVANKKGMSPNSMICRLCGLPSEKSIYIFGPLAHKNMLQYKIIQLLDIAVGQNDNLPHFVCMHCVHKLDSLWIFKNECHRMKFRKTSTAKRVIRPNYEEVINDSCDALQSRFDSSNLSSSGFETQEVSSLTSGSNKRELSSIESVSNSSYVSELPGGTNTGRISLVHASKSELSTNIDNPTKSLSDNEENYEIPCSDGNDSDGSDRDGNDSDVSIELFRSSNTTQSNCKKMNESTSVHEDEKTSSSEKNECFSNTKITSDNSCCGLEPKYTGTENLQESSCLSVTSHPENELIFEGHFFRTETDNNSDLLCNRIPYLPVKSEMGTKRMIYTVFPDSSKFENDHDCMLKIEKFYPKIELFNLEDVNVRQTVVQSLDNLMKGETSLIPYFFGWLNDKNKLNVGFKCFVCKKIIDTINRQSVMNHISDHLLWTCQVCGKLSRNLATFRTHLLRHLSYDFTCSICDMNLGSDLDKWKEHVRTHYKFSCNPCKFECTDDEKWLKHLKNDRKNSKSCSSDCSLFYESIDNLTNHISALAALGGYVCGSCGMAYHCEEYLKLHLSVYGMEHGSKTIETTFQDNSGLASSEKEVENFQKKLNRLRNAEKDKQFNMFEKILANDAVLKEFQSSFIQRGGKLHTGFTCFKCDRNIVNEKAFKIHIENHLSMTCYRCKFFTGRMARLRNHFKNCKFIPRKCISCRNDVWLDTSQEYINHVTLHQKRKICIYCQMVVDSKKLSRHVARHTGNKNQWFCKHCNETLIVPIKNPTYFKKTHFKEKHANKLENFVCEICAKTFDLKYTLNQHLKRKHSSAKNNDDTFICAYCNKEFTRKLSLTSHILNHMNEKKFKCEICAKAFNRETSLYKHKLDMHSVKKHLCSFCDKRFTYPSALVDHMKKAHSLWEKNEVPVQL